MRFDQFIVSTNSGIPSGIKVTYDKDVFKSMVNFITDLQPEQLTQSQTSNIINIIGSFNMMPENEEYNVEDTGVEMINTHKKKMLEWYGKYQEHLDIHRDMNRGWNRLL